MNENVLSGKWKEVKGEMRKAWGDLTDDEIEKTKGNKDSILGLLQQKFGYAQEEASQRFDSLLSRFNLDDTKERLSDNVKKDEAKR